MAGRGYRHDWVDFAAALLMLSGAIGFLQGFIAIVRGNYYGLHPTEILVVDLTTWGWILVFWGSAVALTGTALWFRSSAARWVALGFTAANIVVELGFAGGMQRPLWGIVSVALDTVILYALIVHWHPAEAA